MSSLLALFAKPEVDVSAHLPLATDLALYGIGLLMLFFVVRPELWRRLWFDRVDARPGALTRIFFGLVVFITFFDLLWPMNPLEYSVARYLFTDDGLWLTDMARKNYGGSLRELWDPEQGFEHWYDLLSVMWGKFTIFHLRSDPPFVLTLYFVMLGCIASMIVGFRTRWVTIVAFVLVEMFYRYSPIFYTGGDTVVRVFLFLGMFSRWGEAYSVDTWLRRRKAVLRKGARVVPPLRKIPAWPFRLMMLQLCIIYCATGLLKTGTTWKDGSALYYALNLDHFYRVPATGVVTVAHWSLILPNTAIFVRWWEVFFPLVGLGAALNAYERGRLAGTWPSAALWRKVLGVVVFLAAWAMLARVAGIGAIYFMPPELQAKIPPPQRQGVISAVTMALPIVMLGLYLALRRVAPPVLSFIRLWVLGKRSWLVIGFGMHIGIDVGMNVGTFAEVMMAVYLAWLSGEEVEAFWRYLYSAPCRPGEGGRPIRDHAVVARVLGPIDRLRFRKPGRRFVVHHNPDDASVRRAALLRCLDLGGRLDFVADETVATQTLAVQAEAEPLKRGNAAGAVLTRALPVLLGLRPVRWIPGVGALARIATSQRGSSPPI